MNQSQFAAEMGVNRSQVTHWKNDGRLVFCESGKVDVEASKIRISETADQNRDDVAARHADDRKNKKITTKVIPPVEADEQKINFSEGRAKEQHFKALQAELEYKQTVGELVSTADMKAAVTDLVTTFKQSIENLPHRIAADLVGKDIDFIRATLKQETFNVLAELQRGCEKKLNQVAE